MPKADSACGKQGAKGAARLAQENLDSDAEWSELSLFSAMRTLSLQHFDDVVDPQHQQREIAEKERCPHERGAHSDLRYQLPRFCIVEIRFIFNDLPLKFAGNQAKLPETVTFGPGNGGANRFLMR